MPVFRPPSHHRPVRRLVPLLGDQLDRRHLGAVDFDPQHDAVLMVEARRESTHLPSHRQRTVLFLAAMRHFALDLAAEGIPVHYVVLDDPDRPGQSTGTLGGELERHALRLEAEAIRLVRPGEHRVLAELRDAADGLRVPLEMVENRHFLVDPADFAAWADGRSELVLEHFYRWVRKRDGVLLDEGQPIGGRWNFDKENRNPLGEGAQEITAPLRFPPDAITREVIDLVERALPDAPGSAASFAWPVTADDARRALDDFVAHRLPHFGTYQDAMRRGAPWLFHSLLSPPLNLGLLDPHDAIQAAIEAYERGDAPIHSVEGFVRQILGWREFIRGVYWREGPTYEDRNGLDEHGALPEVYWTGETEMACMADCVGQVLEHGFGHHIQRLMVTGNYALLGGVHPRRVSDWYLAMYVDAVDWVTLPNTLGMVMHADGGVVGTKPYVSTGKYIDRMSDYCGSCRFDPGKRVGDDACPFTTLYWDFLLRHRERFASNRRMALMYGHVDRMDPAERSAIEERARTLRASS